MAKLVLVRHGQSQWNLENRFTGWTDIPLTALGEEEARKAAAELKKIVGLRFDAAFTSDLVRAQRTLDIMLSEMSQTELKVHKDRALNERHYGDLQGLNKTETAERFGADQVKLWRRSYDVRPPGGESLKDTAQRTLPYFKSKILPEAARGKNVLVCAHGNSLRAIVMDLDGLSAEQVVALEIGTGVPMIYEISPSGGVLSKDILLSSPA